MKKFYFESTLPYEFSLVFILITVLFIFTLSSYRFEAKLEQHTERFKELSTFQTKAYKFSEEYFHTQLELWEYAYLPTQNRLDHYKDHRIDLDKKYNDLIDYYSRIQPQVTPQVHQHMKQMIKNYRLISKLWDEAIEIFSSKDEKSWRSTFLIIEEKFDSYDLGNGIHDLNMEISKVSEEEKKEINLDNIYNMVLVQMVLFATLAGFLILHFRSIKVRKEIETQLLQADKLSTLGQLAAGMAHEINNPLMFMQGFANRIRSKLIAQNNATPELIDYLDEVEGGVTRIQKVVKNLQNYSRKNTDQKSLVNVDQVVAKSFELFNQQLKNRNIQVTVDLRSNDLMVLGDPYKLEQVFFNLIVNARDAFDTYKSNEKWIRVSTKTLGTHIFIEFEDNAGGISQKILNKIFDPFFTTKEIGKGTGLGLAIVQKIVSDFEGEIKVTSEIDIGTTFTIILPLSC